jgi:hypothetical protein
MIYLAAQCNLVAAWIMAGLLFFTADTTHFQVLSANVLYACTTMLLSHYAPLGSLV